MKKGLLLIVVLSVLLVMSTSCIPNSGYCEVLHEGKIDWYEVDFSSGLDKVMFSDGKCYSAVVISIATCCGEMERRFCIVEGSYRLLRNNQSFLLLVPTDERYDYCGKTNECRKCGSSK